MSKEIEEEFFAPVCFSHFACEGLVEGMGTQDVVSEASDDGEIFRRVVLARAGVVFVEDNIERPMELVFDAPVRADDCCKLGRREHPGEGHVAHGSLAPTVRAGSLGFDAADRLQAGEVRAARQPACRQDRGSAPFDPAVRPLLGLEEGKLARGREAGLGGSEERSVVGLEPQGQKQKLRKIVPAVLIARVANLPKNPNQRRHRASSTRESPYRIYSNQPGNSSYYSYAIPLASAGARPIQLHDVGGAVFIPPLAEQPAGDRTQ